MTDSTAAAGSPAGVAQPPVYTAAKPPLRETPEQLAARIPGWGADRDPRDRPAVPREVPGIETGAHWTFPDRQPEEQPRERSVEHGMLTPVFGTSVPLKGLSGVIRRRAYARYSEARAAHWLLLIAADRVDAVESHLTSLVRLRPDNPVTQTGIRSETTYHGVSSRLGANRADVGHQAIDPVVVAGPWLVAAGLAMLGADALRRRIDARASAPSGTTTTTSTAPSAGAAPGGPSLPADLGAAAPATRPVAPGPTRTTDPGTTA